MTTHGNHIKSSQPNLLLRTDDRLLHYPMVAHFLFRFVAAPADGRYFFANSSFFE